VDHRLSRRSREHQKKEYQQLNAYQEWYSYDFFHKFPIFLYHIHLPRQRQNLLFQSLNQDRQQKIEKEILL
jgi:hypothetical protein